MYDKHGTCVAGEYIKAHFPLVQQLAALFQGMLDTDRQNKVYWTSLTCLCGGICFLRFLQIQPLKTRKYSLSTSSSCTRDST